MTEPRPELVREILSLKFRLKCTLPELHAAVDFSTQGTRRGRPQSEIYGRLLWAMDSLVYVYGRHRFTAAKQVLGLAGGPSAQREYQARSLVRVFDKYFKHLELRAHQEFYVRQGALGRVLSFYIYWALSRLPLPRDIKSASDMATELKTLLMANNWMFDGGGVIEYSVALDRSIAESTFEAVALASNKQFAADSSRIRGSAG